MSRLILLLLGTVCLARPAVGEVLGAGERSSALLSRHLAAEVWEASLDQAAPFVVPGQGYRLILGVASAPDDRLDRVLTRELIKHGLRLEVRISDHTSSGTLQQSVGVWDLTVRLNHDLQVYEAGFQTGAEPGEISFLVMAAGGISGHGITAHNVRIPVDGSMLRTASGTYTSMLGTFVSSDELQTGVSQFKLSYAEYPRAMPILVLVNDGSDLQIVVTQDQFATPSSADQSLLLQLDQSNLLNATAVCGSVPASGYGVRDAVVLKDRIVFNTYAGVVQAAWTWTSAGSSDVTWTRLSSECITGVTPAMHYSAARRSQDQHSLVAFPGDRAAVLASNAPDHVLAEVLDAQGNGLNQTALGLSAAARVQAAARLPDTLVVLTHDGDTTGVYRFNDTTASWSHALDFAANVTDQAGGLIFSAAVALPEPAAATQKHQLSLSALQGWRVPGNTVFAYGSAVLVSNDAGKSWLMLHALPAGQAVDHLTTSATGYVVWMTNLGEIWASSLADDTPTRLALHRRRGTADMPDLLQRVLFSPDDRLLLIQTRTGATDVRNITRYDIQGEMLRRTSQAAQQQRRLCPVKRVSYTSELLVGPSRNPSGVSDPMQLPSTLMLDFNETANIMLELQPADHIERLAEVRLLVHGLSSALIDVGIQRYQDPVNWLVKYHVRVRDRGLLSRPQAAASTNQQLSTLVLTLANATSSCGAPATQPGLLPAHNAMALQAVSVLTGCPSSRSFRFDAAASHTSAEGCQDTDEYTCLYYGNDFIPVFRIDDHVLGTSDRFRGNYRFTIVAGGETLDSMQPFTEKQQQLYNFGGAESIWNLFDAAEIGQGTMGPGREVLQWVCAAGSPCYDLAPQPGRISPQFFMRVLVTTRDVYQDSYCYHETELTLRVHGIEMAFATTASLIGGTLGFLVLLVIVTYHTSGAHRRERSGASAPLLRPDPGNPASMLG